jgi:hypothetical protein
MTSALDSPAPGGGLSTDTAHLAPPRSTVGTKVDNDPAVDSQRVNGDGIGEEQARRDRHGKEDSARLRVGIRREASFVGGGGGADGTVDARPTKRKGKRGIVAAAAGVGGGHDSRDI